MRERTFWKNHVTTQTGKYNVVQSPKDGANVYSISPFGEVMEQGTPQNAEHFNSMEEGLTALEIAVQMIAAAQRQNAWEVEKGTIQLKNSEVFPFNNSKKTVALTTRRENADYIVIATVKSTDGNVGEIEVTEKLVNGFKIAYTGSAENATVEYQVIGGYLK